jgi:hypothetical protein
MKTLITVLVSLLFTPFAYAGSASVVIASGYNANVPAVRIQVPADFVAVPINIQNSSDDPIKRADEIEKTLRTISEQIRQNPDMSVMSGVVSLSPREQSTFSSFSGSGYDRGSSVQFYILGALKQNANMFAVTKKILQTVNIVSVSDKTKITLGNTTLGLYDPEKFRGKLLGEISKSIAETKKSLGISGTVGVEGLENSVSVMQFNEKDIVVFISYKLKIQTKGT